MSIRSRPIPSPPRSTDGTTIDFDIDPFAKRMILAGTDELGYLLAKDAEISAWEATHPPRINALTPAGQPTAG